MTDGKPISVAWEWPGESNISYKITPEKAGGLMGAANIGRQLVLLSKALEATEDGIRWKTFLRGIYTNEDGSIQFDLAVCPKASSLTSNEGKTK